MLDGPCNQPGMLLDFIEKLLAIHISGHGTIDILFSHSSRSTSNYLMYQQQES